MIERRNALLLDVRNVSVSFRLRAAAQAARGAAIRLKAVDDVSFTIAKGSTVGLVGESGCGKTTLGRAIAGFQKIESGRVLLDGRDISLLDGAALRRERRRIQMIFQNPFASLDPRMTVFQTLSEAIGASGEQYPKKKRIEIAAHYMEQVGLDPALINRFPHEFSGGQRQRIAIARALAVKPSLIIADEPVSSLDVSVAAQVLNLLHSLRDSLGLTMLFISHDLAVVRFISHRIMVMYRGKIVEEGPGEEVFSTPCHPYTALLLKAVPTIPDAGQAASRALFCKPMPHPLPSETHEGGCSFVNRCSFRIDRCMHEVPKLSVLGENNDHHCACFRAGSIDVIN